ncbi:MAG: DEAD/DEAH box helicase [Candidatus Parcubacteria bacterium]|nr:DEAD/DEAH box helicase [Candidatus Parcubacteria bacterium]
MTTVNKKTASFADLGVSPKLLQILANLKFSQPTPIQEQCIPLALAGKDIVGIAQTGTGKTLAFALPIIQILAEKKGQALILLPTRELALQVDDVFQQIGRNIGLKTATIIGGASAYDQKQKIKANPHVIISTPGRLLNHLKEKNLTLQQVKIVVLDEGDRMLDIGFIPDIKRILSATPSERQTFMFSATMPQSIAELAANYLKLPLRIEVAPAGTAAKNVEQELFIVPKENKMRLLDKLLTDTQGTVLIFSRTKFGAKKITANLKAMGFPAAEIHSNRSLAQRTEALKGFKTGRYRILVATDIASRGIDVTDIAYVINFDLPDNTED